MPVLPDFNPENQSFGRTLQFEQSMMERAQNQRIAQARSEQQTQEFQAKLPAIQAQAVADVATAHASVENAALMEQFRAKAASESKSLNDAYLQAIQIPDFEGQARALSALQPRVAYMETLPEYKGFVTAVNNSTVRAHSSALVDRQLNNKLEMVDLKSQSAAEVAKIKAQSDADKLTLQQKHFEETAQLRAELANQKINSTRNVEYDKKVGEGDAKRFSDAQESVTKYQESLDQTARARELLTQDAQQGRGRGTVLAVQQAINAFVPGTFDTAKTETLNQSYAEMALAAASKIRGQGSVTENERNLLATSTAKFGNTPEAARYIMDFMDAVSKREIARATYYADLDAKGERVTAKLANDFLKEHPITEYINSSIKQSPGQDTTTAPATGGGKTLEPLKVLSVTPGG